MQNSADRKADAKMLLIVWKPGVCCLEAAGLCPAKTLTSR